MRSNRLLAASVGLLLALTGCATVPTSGPVEHHTPQAAGVNSGIHVDPLPPANGASQLLVVEGFLHAMGVYQPNYQVARQYLTEPASESWHPESGAEVYMEKDQPIETEQGVALAAIRVGTLSADGVYVPDNTDKRYTFEMVKDQAGQWRISNPPPGLVVSRYLFSTNYTSLNLHFMETAGKFLVPDPRFFASGDQARAAVIRAQLDGPSSWLEPVVEKNVSQDIRVEGMTVDNDGLLTLTLDRAADRLSNAERQSLLAELAYTITTLPGIISIQVNSGGLPWTSGSGQVDVGPETFANLSPEQSSALRVLFAIRDHKVQRLRDPARWDDFVPVEADLNAPEQIAVNHDRTEVAAVSAGGTRLTTAPIGPGKARPLRSGLGLLRPDYARTGELWSFASSGITGLRIFRDGEPVKVDATALPAARLVAAKLSPDGSRIAIVLQQGARTDVGLAIVARNQDGSVTLSGWRDLNVALNTGRPGRALDLGWSSTTQLAVLQTASGGETSVIRISQDGATATDIGPNNSASLQQLAVVSTRPAVVLAFGGRAYRFDDEFNWTLSMAGVEALAYSG